MITQALEALMSLGYHESEVLSTFDKQFTNRNRRVGCCCVGFKNRSIQKIGEGDLDQIRSWTGYNNASLLREARMEMWMRRFSRF